MEDFYSLSDVPADKINFDLLLVSAKVPLSCFKSTNFNINFVFSVIRKN